MKLSHVLRNTFTFVLAVVLLAAGPLAKAQDAEEFGEGVPYSPTAVLGNPSTSVQQVSATQASNMSIIADPTKGISGNQEFDLILPNGPSAAGFTITVNLDVTKGISATSKPLQSIFMINDGQNNDTDVAFALLRDYTGYWYIAKRVDGPISQPLVVYANRLWDPLRSPCVLANSCTYDTIYVTFTTNGSIYLDEYATLSNPASGTSKYSWYEGVVGSGYPVLSYPTGGGLTTPPNSAVNFAPARGVYLGRISVNWFRSVNNPSPGGSNDVGGAINNPVAFDDNVLNGINAYQASIYEISYTKNGILGNGTLQGLRSAIVGNQESYQSTDDQIIVNGIYPCNSGQFENSTPGNTQLSYSPIFLPSPCKRPAAAPLGQLSPSHVNFFSSSQTQTFTVTNVGQATSQLDISLIQVEPIDSNAGTTYLDNFRVTGGSCLVNTVLSFNQSCTVNVQFLPATGGSLLNNNVRLRIYTNADTIAVPLAAPLFGYSDLAVPGNCSSLGYPGCDVNNQTTYTLCASEGGSCSFTGDRNVVLVQMAFIPNPLRSRTV